MLALRSGARLCYHASMGCVLTSLMLTVALGAPSPLISSIFFRNRGEIERSYPTCKIQNVDPLALRCPLTLYHVPNVTLFLFDEVHHVKGVITEFEPQKDLEQSQKILRGLLNDLAVQFGSPKTSRVGIKAKWLWSHSHAIAEVNLEKNGKGRWVVTVAFAEARPPDEDEIPGPKPPKPHPRFAVPVP